MTLARPGLRVYKLYKQAKYFIISKIDLSQNIKDIYFHLQKNDTLIFKTKDKSNVNSSLQGYET